MITERLLSQIFSDQYDGYRPTPLEAPNGDGKIDEAKRYAHIALKYQHADPKVQDKLDCLLVAAHAKAVRVAHALGVPEAFMPKIAYGALRVLDYPPGAGSHVHTDMGLFTVCLYRGHPKCLQGDFHELPEAVKAIDDKTHIGELGELVGLGPATRHWVVASEERQVSMVYFAIPDWAAVLPDGRTVGEYLVERLGRSRKERLQEPG